jgi:hypothetical protein
LERSLWDCFRLPCGDAAFRTRREQSEEEFSRKATPDAAIGMQENAWRFPQAVTRENSDANGNGRCWKAAMRIRRAIAERQFAGAVTVRVFFWYLPGTSGAHCPPKCPLANLIDAPTMSCVSAEAATESLWRASKLAAARTADFCPIPIHPRPPFWMRFDTAPEE